MKPTLAIITLGLVGLVIAVPAIAQQRPQSRVAQPGQRQAQAQGQHQPPPARPLYQRRDTWYEFLLKQFNPDNFDYGDWMEERRQVFLGASVRNHTSSTALVYEWLDISIEIRIVESVSFVVMVHHIPQRHEHVSQVGRFEGCNVFFLLGNEKGYGGRGRHQCYYAAIACF
jgi:hypothetical protein